MATLRKQCKCHDEKAGRKLNLRDPRDKQTAMRNWKKCGHDWRVSDKPSRTAKEVYDYFPANMLADAEERLRQIESGKVNHLKLIPDLKVGAVPFPDVCDLWFAEWQRENTDSPSTVDKYVGYLKNHIRPYFENRRMDSITPQDIEKFRDHMGVKKQPNGKPYAASTIRGCMSVIRMSCMFAVKEKFVLMTPYVGVKMPDKKPKEHRPVATWAQVIKLVLAMPAHLRLATLVMAVTGCRIGEALGLREDCLIANDTVLVFRHQYSRKYGQRRLKHRKREEDRKSPIPPFLRRAVREQIDKIVSGYLTPGTKAPVVSDETFRKYFKRALKAAGLPEDFRPHDLRHSFTTNQLAAGANPTDVALWGGWRDLATLLNYNNVVVDLLTAAGDDWETKYPEFALTA